jgi:hypothetical protein
MRSEDPLDHIFPMDSMAANLQHPGRWELFRIINCSGISFNQ